MIVAAEKQEIKETAQVVRFQSGPPSHNPFVPSSPLSMRREGGGVVLEWLHASESSAADLAREIAAEMVSRSEHEVRKYPNSSRARTNLAVALANAGEVERAILVFREALDLDSKNYVAASKLGKILIEKNRFREAEDVYKHLRAHFQGNVTPLISLAVLAMRRNEFDEAERLLREGLTFGIKSAALHYQLAIVLLGRGETREAISRLKAALQIDVRSPGLYQALGIAYALAGDHAKSSRAFHTALQLSPRFGDAVRGLANTLLRVRQTEAAIEVLGSYLEHNSTDSQARLILAQAYLQKERFSSARAQFLEVYQHTAEADDADRATRSELANDIGVCYYREKDLRHAEQWFQKSINYSPEHGTLPYRNIGGVYVELDKAQSALPILSQGKALFPNDEEISLLLAYFLDSVGRTNKAIAELEPFVAKNDSGPGVYGTLGCYLADVGDFNRAVEVLERGYAKFPLNNLIANNLAYVHLMVGDVEHARRVLESPGAQGEDVALIATRGLLRLKEGTIDEARQLYVAAARLAAQEGSKSLAETVRQKMHLEFARYWISSGNDKAAASEIEKGLGAGKGRRVYRLALERLRRALPH